MSFQEWMQIAYYFLAFVLVFSGLNVARSWVRVKKESNDLKNFELQISCPNNTDALKLLDTLIAETISEYVLLNRSSLNLNQDHINSEEETKMVHDIADLVSTRLSPILLAKLSIYYTNEALSEIIGNKTYIQVTAYAVSINSIKKEEK